MVDKGSGKLIKAIDERSLSDFLPLLTKEDPEKSKVVLFDFALVVQYFHNELDSKLAQREHKELFVKRATVFNTWMRLKSVTNEMLLCNSVSQVMRDSEEVLNWIHTRLPALERDYNQADKNNNQGSFRNEKKEALLKLSDEIEAFIEVLLCSIHSTAKVDIKSFQSDSVITGHCESIRNLILRALASEVGYWNGNFNSQSLIYHCCMENLDINAEALLSLLNSDITVEKIKADVWSSGVIKDNSDGYKNTREFSVSWPSADNNEIERVKILSQLLEKINSLISIIEKLKTGNVYFENDHQKQEEFDRDINKLLPSR